MWFQQETATALANLETAIDADCTTLASVTSDLDTANTDIASLKNQPKNSKQP